MIQEVLKRNLINRNNSDKTQLSPVKRHRETKYTSFQPNYFSTIHYFIYRPLQTKIELNPKINSTAQSSPHNPTTKQCIQ